MAFVNPFGQPAQRPAAGGFGVFGGQQAKAAAPGADGQATDKYSLAYEIPQAAGDTVMSLSFAKTAPLLAAGCWDMCVRVWEIQVQIQPPALNAIPRREHRHQAPVLSVAFKDDGTALFSGSCDGEVKALDLQSGNAVTLGKHERGVRHLCWVEKLQVLISGGWDKRLGFWQLTGAKEFVDLGERVYAMDVKFPLLLVATAERGLYCFDLSSPNPKQPVTQGLMPQLRFQTRCLSVFTDGKGFVAGSMEGRCCVFSLPVPPNNQSGGFAFKAHRHQFVQQGGSKSEVVYGVAAIDFHPQSPGVFATGGGDGGIIFWDKENKSRVRQLDAVGIPVTCVKFNGEGTLIAVAFGEDWVKGPPISAAPQAPKIVLGVVTPADVAPKPKPANSGTSPGRR